MEVFCSLNSRYFLFREGTKIFLKRASRIYWKKTIEKKDYTILGVGNNGDVFYILNNEVIIVPFNDPQKEYKIDLKKELVQENKSFQLQNFHLNDSGDHIACEKVVSKIEVTEKIVKFFKLSELTSKDLILCEIIIYDILTGGKKKIYECILDRKSKESLTWDISKNFYNLLVIKVKKEEGKYQYDIFTLAGIGEHKKVNFQLSDVKIEDTIVHNNGTAAITYSYKDKKEMVVFMDSGKFFKLSLESGYEVLHLTANEAVFWNKDELIVKNYHNEDELVYRVSFKGLDKLGFNYKILFDERDDVNLVLYKGKKMKILLIELQHLPIEVKRWKFLAENLGEVIKEKESVFMPHFKVDLKKYEKKSKEILRTVFSIKKERMDKEKKKK